MSVGLGIGSGFAQGLARVLLGKRQRDQEEAFTKENRNINIKLALLPEILKRAADYSDVEPFITELIGEPTKGKKGQPDVHGIMSQAIAPILAQNQSGLTPGQEVENVAAKALGDQLPSRAPVSSGTPAPVRQTLFGVPLLSEEEMAGRDLSLATAVTTATEKAKLDAQTEAKMSLARRLRELDPSMSVEDSLIAVGLKVPKDQYGVIPQGGGVLNRSTGEIIESPSAKVANLPATLRERVEELRSIHPEWGDDQLRREASTQIASEREADRVSKEAARESVAATRSLQQTLLQMQANQGGITPNNAASLTMQLRKEWTKAVEPFKSRETYVAKLNEAITPDKTGKTMIQRDRNAATQTIVNSFNRLLEETNAVREGEYRRSEDLTPYLTRIEAALNRITLGGGRLTDAQLTSLAKEGREIANAVKDVHEEGIRDLRLGMTQQLGRYNIPTTDVFGNSKIGAPKFTTTLNGKAYEFDTQTKLAAFKRQFPEAQ